MSSNSQSKMDKLWERLCSGKPFFIAEAGVNHLGDLKLGERLIREAAEAGAHAIKFQSYKAKNLCTKNAPRFWDWGGELESEGSQFDSYSHLDSFGEKEHAELKSMCDYHGIEFMSTPFDKEAVDYLDRVGINAYKIASCDVTNIPLLRYVGSKRKIVMLSTGASDREEVKTAIRALTKQGSLRSPRIVVMHCNLKYPTDASEINLNAINSLEGLGQLTGLSDHTREVETPAFAVAMGATIVEKHFTVDKTLGKSADHWLSVDPEEVRRIVELMELAYTMKGSADKVCTPSEERAKKYARRSVVTTAAIKKGELFSEENIACKRPGTGIPPIEFELVLGKPASRDLLDDYILGYDDIVE